MRLIVVDSLERTRLLGHIADELRTSAPILLRINPDYVPRGMNQGTATGSRRGLRLRPRPQRGRARRGALRLRRNSLAPFPGLPHSIGTGIRNPREYARAFDRLAPLVRDSRAAGFPVEIMDVGGGFASMTTRELTTREFLIYQGLGELPSGASAAAASFEDFGREISAALQEYLRAGELPELLLEPGRCIASPNQVLLLTVRQVKTRPNVRTWIITDGGLGTVIASDLL